MKKWKVTAELFWSAERIESVVVKANTERKARLYAENVFKKEYPDVGSMISIQSIERVE